MARLTDFVGKGLMLLFEYPIAVIVQILCLGSFFKGVSLATHAFGVEQLVVYKSMQELSPAYGPEILGVFLAAIAFATFWGFFFINHKIIFVGTYLVTGYWLTITALYLLEGVGAAAIFYSGVYVLILLYCIIYVTLNRNKKLSPYKVLTGKGPATRLDTVRN